MMKYAYVNCPNCGERLEVDYQRKMGHCHFCENDYYLEKQKGKQYCAVERRTFDPRLTNEDICEKKNNMRVCLAIFLGVCLAVVMILYCEKENWGRIISCGSQSSAEYTEVESSNHPPDFIQQALSLIFQKPISDLSKEDKAKIRYLRFGSVIEPETNQAVCEIQYSFSDYKNMSDEDFIKTVKILYVLEKDMDWGLNVYEIKELENLTRLEIPIFDSSTVDFSSYGSDVLGNISSLFISGDNLNAICDYVDISNIVELGIGYGFDSLEGIERFPNLRKVAVESESISDLSPLSNCTGLEGLSLCVTNQVGDFSVLNELSNLTQLYLGTPLLEDISFISKMNKLEELTLDKTSINDLEYLRGVNSLKSLTLLYNNRLIDLSPIESLTNLEKLNLDAYNKEHLELVSELPKLRELGISMNGGCPLSFLEKIQRLEMLTLVSCNIDDNLACLQNLEKLHTLKLYKVFNLDNFRELKDIKSLKNLDLADSSFTSDITSVFGIGSLEVLNLNQCNFTGNFHKISELKNLKELYMNGLSVNYNHLLEDGVSSNDLVDEEKSMDDYLMDIAGCKKLEKLEMNSDDITTINFIKKLPKMKYFSFVNNQVRDITPIYGMKQLEVVKPYLNPCDGLNPMDGVTIYVDSGHLLYED